MPRTHVSVARFYDWSTDLAECISVSQQYQVFGRSNTVPSSPRMNLPATEWHDGRNLRLHPLNGRMFIKDKTPSLTKGEREIIDGICRNRSDIPKAATSSSFEEPGVLRHNEAWAVGRNTPKPRLKYIHARLKTDVDQLRYDKHNALLESTPIRGTGTSFCHEYNEGSGFDSCLDTISRCSSMGVVAPPCSPEMVIKQEKVPPINNGCGAVLIEKVHAPNDATVENKPKMILNIFLPKMQCESFDTEVETNSDSKVRQRKPPQTIKSPNTVQRKSSRLINNDGSRAVKGRHN